MELIKYVILGIIQGFTEPLPISSSGHLLIFRELFNTNMFNDLNFEVMVNFGSFIAILIIFWKDIVRLVTSFFKYLFADKKDKKKDSTNVYVVAELEGFDEELMAEELKVGMKQYKYALKEKGFTICRENSYKNNDKKLNGKKGKVVSMKNAGKDTTKLEKEIKIAENKVEEDINNEETEIDEKYFASKVKTVVVKSNVNKDRWGNSSPFNDGYNLFKSQNEFLKSINKDEDDIIDRLL